MNVHCVHLLQGQRWKLKTLYLSKVLDIGILGPVQVKILQRRGREKKCLHKKKSSLRLKSHIREKKNIFVTDPHRFTVDQSHLTGGLCHVLCLQWMTLIKLYFENQIRKYLPTNKEMAHYHKHPDFEETLRLFRRKTTYWFERGTILTTTPLHWCVPKKQRASMYVPMSTVWVCLRVVCICPLSLLLCVLVCS